MSYGSPHSCLPRMQIKPFVRNADTILRWSKRLLPETIVEGIVKRTFFAHFCGGAVGLSMGLTDYLVEVEPCRAVLSCPSCCTGL